MSTNEALRGLLDELTKEQLIDMLFEAKILFKFEITSCENCEKVFVAGNLKKKFCTDTCRVYQSRGISRREPDYIKEGRKRASNGMTYDELFPNFKRWWRDYGNVRDYGQEVNVYDNREEWNAILDYVWRRLSAENPGEFIKNHLK